MIGTCFQGRDFWGGGGVSGNVIIAGIIKMFLDLYFSWQTWREIPADLWRR